MNVPNTPVICVPNSKNGKFYVYVYLLQLKIKTDMLEENKDENIYKVIVRNACLIRTYVLDAIKKMNKLTTGKCKISPWQTTRNQKNKKVKTVSQIKRKRNTEKVQMANM